MTGFEPEDFWADGDVVVSTGGFSAVVRGTGTPFTSRWIMVYGLRDGRVARYEQFHDGALAAAFR